MLRVKNETLMKKLILAYEKKLNAKPGTFEFKFDGESVDPLKTVAEMEINDGDSVDVMVAQVGGA